MNQQVMLAYCKQVFFSNKNLTRSVCSALNTSYASSRAHYILMAQFCRPNKCPPPNTCSKDLMCVVPFHKSFNSFPPCQVLFHILSCILKNIYHLPFYLQASKKIMRVYTFGSIMPSLDNLPF